MSIYLKSIKSFSMDNINDYPFNIPSFHKGIDIEVENQVLILVGENGAGKSTLLNAIADSCGFDLKGGNQNHSYGEKQKNLLTDKLRLSWYPKIKQGFFMKAENFNAFSDYIDSLAESDRGIYEGYGGKSFNHQSHGEAFFSLFSNHFKKGIFILDEPESALSPSKQIAFLALIEKLVSNNAQFIIATHSPIIMSIPNAHIIQLNNEGIKKIGYKETEHYKITKLFLDCPDRFYKGFKE